MTGKQLVNPLAAAIAKAKQSLPADTGATARAAYLRSPDRHVILADVSQSMAEPAGQRRKVDILAEALRGVPSGSEIVAFNGSVMPLKSPALPEPSGSTALHLALEHCLAIGATRLLVISDGHPDQPDQALKIADKLDARIDVIYCGPESDAAGMAYMRRLARGGGRATHQSLSNQPQAVQHIRTLMRLALTAPRQ